MRIAFLSDIHANIQALRACVDHAHRRGVDAWAFLGDLVNYGADPLPCLDLVRELAGDEPLAVRGNHDEASLGGLCESMNPEAREALYWTRAQLGLSERTFLASLPLEARFEDILLVHASAHAPADWQYVDGAVAARRCLDSAASARVVVAGHIHAPRLYHRSGTRTQPFQPVPGVPVPLTGRRHWLVLAGSVGQPRDGINAAAWTLVDTLRNEATLFRVPYDHGTASCAILAAGLPSALAWRLARGV